MVFIAHPALGTITFDGNVISGLGPDKIARTWASCARFSVSRCFRILRFWKTSNIGRHLHARQTVLGTLFGGKSENEHDNLKKAEDILEFLNMSAYRDEVSSNLPYGLQRALGVAIALATEPRLFDAGRTGGPV